VYGFSPPFDSLIIIISPRHPLHDRYGSAFLSLDAGATFLDGGATSIVAASPSPSPASALMRLNKTFPPASSAVAGASPGVSPLAPHGGRGDFVVAGSAKRSVLRASSRRKLALDGELSDGGSMGCGSISEGDSEGEGSPVGPPTGTGAGGGRRQGEVVLSKELDEVRAALQLLSEPDFKWAERVETLRRLHNALINIATLAAASCGGGAVNGRDDIPETLLTEVLSSLTLCVTKVQMIRPRRAFSRPLS